MAQNFSKIVEVDQIVPVDVNSMPDVTVVAIPDVTVTSLPPITGTVAVNNLPIVQPVNDNGGSLTVDGSVSVSNFPATQPVSGTVTISGSVAVTGPLTDAQLRATAVPVSGTVAVSSLPSTTVGTATVTRVVVVPSSATTLLASNVSRMMAIIHNETGTLFLKFGSTASDTDYTYRLVGNTVLEIDKYYGIITARKASGTTDVQVTEL